MKINVVRLLVRVALSLFLVSNTTTRLAAHDFPPVHSPWSHLSSQCFPPLHEKTVSPSQPIARQYASPRSPLSTQCPISAATDSLMTRIASQVSDVVQQSWREYRSPIRAWLFLPAHANRSAEANPIAEVTAADFRSESLIRVARQLSLPMTKELPSTIVVNRPVAGRPPQPQLLAQTDLTVRLPLTGQPPRPKKPSSSRSQWYLTQSQTRFLEEYHPYDFDNNDREVWALPFRSQRELAQSNFVIRRDAALCRECLAHALVAAKVIQRSLGSELTAGEHSQALGRRAALSIQSASRHWTVAIARGAKQLLDTRESQIAPYFTNPQWIIYEIPGAHAVVMTVDQARQFGLVRQYEQSYLARDAHPTEVQPTNGTCPVLQLLAKAVKASTDYYRVRADEYLSWIEGTRAIGIALSQESSMR